MVTHKKEYPPEELISGHKKKQNEIRIKSEQMI